MPEPSPRLVGIDPVVGEPTLAVVRAGRRRFRVRRVDIEPLSLVPGLVLTAEHLLHLEQATSTARAWTAAMRMLARTPIAQATMRAKLGQRFGDAAAHCVVDELTRAGLIDDVQAAESLRRRLERAGPIGPAKFARALAQQHIDPDVAEAAVHDLDTGQDAMEAATAAARAILPALARLNSETRRRRLAGRLARRGFDADTVLQVLEHVCEMPIDNSRYDADP